MKKLGTLTALAVILVVLSLTALALLRIGNVRNPDKLVYAAMSGDLSKVKALLQSGASINGQSPKAFGWTPLIAAIFHNQTNIINFLIQSGADVNLADRSGKTALMWEAGNGDEGIDVVKVLIGHGANLNAKDGQGSTVFDYADSQPPKPKLIKVLNDAKRDVENKPRQQLAH